MKKKPKNEMEQLTDIVPIGLEISELIQSLNDIKDKYNEKYDNIYLSYANKYGDDVLVFTGFKRAYYNSKDR